MKKIMICRCQPIKQWSLLISSQTMISKTSSTPLANSSTSAVDSSPSTAIWESSGNRCSSGIPPAKNQAQWQFWLRTSSINWFHSFVLLLVLVLDNVYLGCFPFGFLNRTLTYQRQICDLLSGVIKMFMHCLR